MEIDWGTLISVTVGFLLGLISLIIAQRLNMQATRVSQNREWNIRAVYEAYGPAYQIIWDMIRTFPNHGQERGSLRVHLRQHRMYFNDIDAEHISVALADPAEMDDLIAVRHHLRESMIRKEMDLWTYGRRRNE